MLTYLEDENNMLSPADGENNKKTADSDKPAQTLFFDDALAAICSAAPEGSTVCTVGFDDNDAFLRAGYRIVENDCDVCIARGGEREFAAARAVPHKKLILLPTQAHYAAACRMFRTETRSFARLCTGEQPYAAVFDIKHMHENHAALFGEIVSLDLAAFDLSFGARMDGLRVGSDFSADIAELISALTDELRAIEKDTASISKALIRAGRRAAGIVGKTPELLHASGAAQAAEAYRMLCAAENRQVGMRGEVEMIFGAYVTDFYIKSLTSKSFDFPPDNNKRLDGMCTYLGADVRRACLSITPIYPPQRLRLCEYRINEFRSELIRSLAEITKRRTAAWQVFKRLYPDDGFGLKTLVDKTDAPICVALAPDVFKTNSLLSFLKQAGKLEKYVV